MTAIGIAASQIRRPAFAAILRRVAVGLAPAAPDADEARARRAFVQEMIARNPDAFSSDLDVHALMQHYPGQL
ncbi:hypothetical protein [Jannaschia seohaensis]|uniref:Uncharacterized protein n=1 Tax=Jannaschia seohaensis TaxID=475081 RepID=A0A2Y9AFD2_9RHOB|nr:hypothetical protein [Jannaschia seohaensis]PWJ21382.1 hypothetical protein BCF38_102635 [Jannaschia seohaensis]SSA41988.1 hypothetical protein SAMN05421539_102635 [Jannaschia seohaensis]